MKHFLLLCSHLASKMHTALLPHAEIWKIPWTGVGKNVESSPEQKVRCYPKKVDRESLSRGLGFALFWGLLHFHQHEVMSGMLCTFGVDWGWYGAGAEAHSRIWIGAITRAGGARRHWNQLNKPTTKSAETASCAFPELLFHTQLCLQMINLLS